MGKLIEDRVNSAEFVASAIDTHAAALDARFQQQFAKNIHRGEHVHLKPVLDVLARALRANATALKDASDAHDRELADDEPARSSRDEVTAVLVKELTSLRAAVETTYGPEAAARLGFDGRTPSDPKGTLTLTRKVLGTLADPHFAWPRAVHKGLRLDPSQWIADLTAHAKQLDGSLKSVNREIREAEQTQTARDATEHAHDEGFGPTASVISALMTLLGERDLATRVRPSIRRPGTVDPVEEPAAGSSDTATTTAAAPKTSS